MASSLLKIQIRPFALSDTSDISEILKNQRDLAVFQKYPTPDPSSYPESAVNFVAEHKGKVIGRLVIDTLYPMYLQVLNFAIHPKYRNKGVDEQLVDYAIKYASKRPAIIPFLETNPNNTSCDIYQKQGFVEVIPGTKELNSWMLKTDQIPLLKDFQKQYAEDVKLEQINTYQEDKVKEFIPMNSLRKKDLIKPVEQLSRKYYLQYNIEDAPYSLKFTIKGCPGKPSTVVDDERRILGFPPTITGIKTQQKYFSFKANCNILSEKGTLEVSVENTNHIPLTFNVSGITMRHTKIHGLPNQITIQSGETWKVELTLEVFPEFNPECLTYSAFEGIPVTILFTDPTFRVPLFHVSENFSYKLLDNQG